MFCAVAAALVGAAAVRFPETLDPAHRRPLTLGRSAEAARAIVGSRWAIGHGLVLMFEFTAFYVYLSSSELVFDDVFGRRAWFAWCFAASAVLQAAGNLVAARLAPIVGTAVLMSRVIAGYVVVGAVFLGVTIGGDGRPSFAPWLGLLWVLNVLHALVLTMANSQAMQPLAALAGTGSGLIGTMSMMGAAVMSSFVASTIRGSATPMAAAYAGFGGLAAVSLWWARSDPGRRHDRAIVDRIVDQN